MREVDSKKPSNNYYTATYEGYNEGESGQQTEGQVTECKRGRVPTTSLKEAPYLSEGPAVDTLKVKQGRPL